MLELVFKKELKIPKPFAGQRDDNSDTVDLLCPDCGACDQLGSFCSKCGISMSLRPEDLIGEM